MANSMSQKVAIVTGGGSGIGEGLCRELARRGARVIVADVNSAEAGRVAAAITRDGGQATASTVDVSRAEEVTRVAKRPPPRTADWTTCSITPAWPSAGTSAT
jgi:NAD(P)-dependent dehydrogenase (short-subunit alcohol dehydrogenase family)